MLNMEITEKCNCNSPTAVMPKVDESVQFWKLNAMSNLLNLLHAKQSDQLDTAGQHWIWLRDF